MRSERTGLVVLAVACALAPAGCRFFDESLLENVDAGETRDAGPDAGERDAGVEAGPADAGPSCPLHRPPPRPEMADQPGDEEFVFALDGINLDQGDEWSTIGYDLDSLCTTAAAPDVECLAPDTSSPALDGMGGIDNVLGSDVLPLILATMPDLSTQSLDDMHKGIGSIIVIVRGWNGADDDPLVDVVVAQSVFGTPALPDGGMPEPEVPDGGIVYYDGGSVPPEPRWDGNDWWWVRVETFLDGDVNQPAIRDDRAYVAGGTLVIRLPNRVPIILSGTERASIIKLTDGRLTLDVAEDRETVPRAVLAGRWALSDVLRDIESAGICRDQTLYAAFSRLLDLAADVRAVPGSGGDDVTCDALSVATTFNGVRAHFGGLSDLFRIPTPCADAGVDGGDGS